LTTGAAEDRYNIQMKLLWYPNFQDEGMKAKKWSILHSFLTPKEVERTQFSAGSASRDMGVSGDGKSASAVQMLVARCHIACDGWFEYNDRVRNDGGATGFGCG